MRDLAVLQFGTAIVSVPKRDDISKLPHAGLIEWVFRVDPDPAKHFILERIDPVPTRQAYFNDLKQAIAKSKLKEAFVFVHGFNTSFRDGLYRTAALAADLAIDGAPILYSWPSNGSPMAYLVDSNQLTAPVTDDLSSFLYDVATTLGASKVHMIAHSMGNRFLLAALEKIAAAHPSGNPIVNELVFASPDLDADDFETRAPTIAHLARRTTLYSSEVDEALRLSSLLQKYSRAGNHRPALYVNKLETVDTTKASGSFEFLGHTDFAGPALDDFRSIVWLSLTPSKRCILSQTEGAGGMVWVFGTQKCNGDAYRRAVLFTRVNRSDLNATVAALNGEIAKLKAEGKTGPASELEAAREVVKGFR